MKRTKTFSLAFSAVIAALSLVFMLLTGLIPVGTYALPCIGGVLLAAVVIEVGYGMATAVYIVVSALSFLLAADKEAALYYAVFLGFYPILKGLIERIGSRFYQFILKLLLFNLSMVAAFYIGIHLLSIPRESFELFGIYLPWVFLIVGNFIFVIYDFCLTRIITLYIDSWRNKLKFK